MGIEAKTVKQRKCRECLNVFETTAVEMVKHAAECAAKEAK